jgi:integrase
MIRFDISVDENGKRKQKAIGGFKTKREAEKALAESIAKVEKGEYFETSQSTLKEYLDYWMETYAKQNVAPTTYERYGFFVQDLKPLWNIKLNAIKPFHVQNYYSKLIDEGKKSNSTILKIHRFLHLALKHAVKWQIVLNNIADAVTPPKAEKVEMKVWDSKTANQFLDLIKDEPIYMAVLLAIHTGMRRGEICALRWRDIDLKKGVIYVQNNLQKVNGKLELVSPKTKKSQRTIVLIRATIKELKKYKKMQKKSKVISISNDFLFVWPDGTLIYPSYFTDKFKELVKRHSFPEIRFHDLRHTHATMLLQQGVNPKIVSERLGHSNISITLDTYTHVSDTIQKDAVEKLDSLFR